VRNLALTLQNNVLRKTLAAKRKNVKNGLQKMSYLGLLKFVLFTEINKTNKKFWEELIAYFP
jgi:hypothetical protein